MQRYSISRPKRIHTATHVARESAPHSSVRLGRLFTFTVCNVKRFSFQNTPKSAETLHRSTTLR